jgi:hypothetical protein
MAPYCPLGACATRAPFVCRLSGAGTFALTMEGMRCPSCGDTRWHLSSIPLVAKRSTACVICGTEVVPERRLPGRGLRALVTERRDDTAPTRPASPA